MSVLGKQRIDTVAFPRLSVQQKRKCEVSDRLCVNYLTSDSTSEILKN